MTISQRIQEHEESLLSSAGNKPLSKIITQLLLLSEDLPLGPSPPKARTLHRSKAFKLLHAIFPRWWLKKTLTFQCCPSSDWWSLLKPSSCCDFEHIFLQALPRPSANPWKHKRSLGVFHTLAAFHLQLMNPPGFCSFRRTSHACSFNDMARWVIEWLLVEWEFARNNRTSNNCRKFGHDLSIRRPIGFLWWWVCHCLSSFSPSACFGEWKIFAGAAAADHSATLFPAVAPSMKTPQCCWENAAWAEWECVGRVGNAWQNQRHHSTVQAKERMIEKVRSCRKLNAPTSQATR